jgi:hypothetical protein
VRLGNARAKVRVVDGRLTDFWGLWCQGMAGVMVASWGIGYVAEVAEVDEGFGCMTEVAVRG